jgi:carboxylesterase type B
MSTLPVLIALATSLLQVATYSELRIPQGNLKGIRSKSHAGHEFISYLGIPYALPPTGKHRFRVSCTLSP